MLQAPLGHAIAAGALYSLFMAAAAAADASVTLPRLPALTEAEATEAEAQAAEAAAGVEAAQARRCVAQCTSCVLPKLEGTPDLVPLSQSGGWALVSAADRGDEHRCGADVESAAHSKRAAAPNPRASRLRFAHVMKPQSGAPGW